MNRQKFNEYFRRKRPYRALVVACLVPTLWVLSNAPIPTFSQKKWVNASAAATIHLLKPEATQKEIQERVNQTNFWRESVANTLRKWRGKDVKSAMTWLEYPARIVELIEPDVTTVAHEVIHADSSLTRNDSLASYAVDEYVGQLGKQTKKMQPGTIFLGTELPRYKIKKISRDGRGWTALLEKDGKQYRLTRHPKGIRLVKLGKRSAEEFFEEWKVPNVEKYLVPASLQQRTEWRSQHNQSGLNSDIKKASQGLCDHAGTLDRFFQTPGTGAAFLKLVLVDGKPEMQAEWEAINENDGYKRLVKQNFVNAEKLYKKNE